MGVMRGELVMLLLWWCTVLLLHMNGGCGDGQQNMVCHSHRMLYIFNYLGVTSIHERHLLAFTEEVGPKFQLSTG